MTKARERRHRLLTLVRYISPVRGAMTVGELTRFTRYDPDPIPQLAARNHLEALAADGLLVRVPCGAAIVAYRIPQPPLETGS